MITSESEWKKIFSELLSMLERFWSDFESICSTYKDLSAQVTLFVDVLGTFISHRMSLEVTLLLSFCPLYTVHLPTPCCCSEFSLHCSLSLCLPYRQYFPWEHGLLPLFGVLTVGCVHAQL